MLVDLHAQTQNAGSRGTEPARVIEAARAAGLDAVAFVDRLHSSHADDLVEAGRKADFPVFVGVEIPASLGRFLCFAPELDPFYTREEWRQLMAVTMPPTSARIIQLFDDMGGAVLASQPYEREGGMRLGDSLIFCDGLAGVEAWTPVHSAVDCSLAVEAGIKMGLPLAGGSAGSPQIGRCATLLGAEVSTQAEFVAALKAGNFWAVQLGEVQGRRSGSRSRRRSSGPPGDRSGGGRGGGGRGGGGRGGRSDGGGRGPRRRRGGGDG